MKITLAAHLLCSLGMFGVIWIVQLVHYPLFDRVDKDDYVSFQQAHEARISFVVLPLMLGELLSGIALATAAADEVRPIWWLGLLLIAVAWMATFLLSVPAHQTLGNGFDPVAHRRLVSTNWIRTAAWSIHAILVLYAAFAMLESPDDRAAEIGSAAASVVRD